MNIRLYVASAAHIILTFDEEKFCFIVSQYT